MHLPKSWKDVGSVKDAFIPKRRGKDDQRRERRPKTKKAKKGAKKREKKASKPKKIEACPQATYAGKGWQFRQCLPFGSSVILPENLAQPGPGRASSSPERADGGNSATPLPSRRRSYAKAATWSSTLSSAGNSLSFAASKIKDALLRRRHTDLSQSLLSPPRSRAPMQPFKHNSMPPVSSGNTENERPAPNMPSRESVSMTAPSKSPTPTTRIRTIPKGASNFQALREGLRKRAATSKEFNEIWESEGLPHLRKTLNDNYNGDYSITIQFNYDSSTRLVEVMTSKILSNHVHQEVKSKVLPCFEHAPQLMVEIHFLVGNVIHTVDIPRLSQDSEDQWAKPKNPFKYSVQVCGDSIGVEGTDGAATLGPAAKLGNNRGWLINWHLFEGIQNWATLDVGSGVPDHHLVHPAPMDCPENKSPKTIAKLHAFSGPMFKTYRPSKSLRLFATAIPHDGETTMNVVTDWAFCIANRDKRLQNRLRYAPPGIEFEDVSGLMRGQFMGNPQLQIIGTTGRSSGFRYAVVCETPAEVRKLPMEPTREWYLEQANIVSTFDWVCEGPGMPGDSGAAVVHEETECVLGQIWGRNCYGGSQSDLRVTYFTHIMDIFDDIRDRYPNEGPLTLILGEDNRTSNTNLRNGPSTLNAPRLTSTLDTSVRSTMWDTGDEHTTDERMGEEPTWGMGHQNMSRRSAANASFEDDGIMMRRSSMMIAT